MNKKISIIIPAFNEQSNFLPVYNELFSVFKNLDYAWEIIFVNDGSTDDSLYVLQKLSQKFSNVYYLSFSRNFGKDNALKAGLDISSGDAVITMDADLQHPPNLIPQLIEKWEEGYEIVYAFRKGKNPHVSFFHKIYSTLFWKFLGLVSGLKLEDGISDFRILDKKVIEVLRPMTEFELFLRGMIKWVGFNQIGVQYVPNERFTGDSAYSKKALIRLAIHGITSFSIRPLYAAIYLGFIFSFLSLLFIPYVFYSLYIHAEVPGWASIIMTLVFFGGLQLIMLGVIGIYVGKMFLQTKERPNYIIQFHNLNHLK